MIRRDYLRLGIGAAVALAAGCQKADAPRPAPSVSIELPNQEQWTDVASAGHAARIANLDSLWTEALDSARKAGLTRQVANEAALLDPSAALARPAPTPGFYMCRIIRFGAPGTKQRAMSVYREFFCFVGANNGHLALTKDGGSERPGGYLWDDDGNDRRMIFLGAVALGAEKAPLPYGEDVSRDVAGVFERIGDFHFRLVMPNPRPDSRLDVMELRAAPAD
ncbi:DUF4893 domain-containing protein [Allosphingosinicella vermicomposti]|uniref:DUF4893 domain-containing protein n=1 Tax=Allosphingosinicella vermicomposti TaxID=614671 RepID=UPI000D0EDDB8|nr:DUF4893 domain-containing protein [Allosphingosinicella vermicomposti]